MSWDYRGIDIQEFKKDLAFADWECLGTSDDIDVVAKHFEDVITTILDKHTMLILRKLMVNKRGPLSSKTIDLM